MLLTRDAEGLYARYGFEPVTAGPPIVMAKRGEVTYRPDE